MIGTIANTGTIILGSTMGALLKKGVPERFKKPLIQAMGLAALALGANMIVSNMMKNDEPLLFIVSLALGCLAGTALRLSERVDALGGSKAERAEGERHLMEGLTTAVLLFCIGTLSILGPVESALNGNHTLLFTNALLDGITSFILASSFGIGIILSAPILFLWQGSIYLIAMLSGGIIPPQLLVQLSLLGGILILTTGLNILEVLKLKTLDFLPSLLVPVLYFLLRALI
jgi:uncharacterized membrane protein YqgA involved in biofilm formation